MRQSEQLKDKKEIYFQDWKRQFCTKTSNGNYIYKDKEYSLENIFAKWFYGDI